MLRMFTSSYCSWGVTFYGFMKEEVDFIINGTNLKLHKNLQASCCLVKHKMKGKLKNVVRVLLAQEFNRTLSRDKIASIIPAYKTVDLDLEKVLNIAVEHFIFFKRPIKKNNYFSTDYFKSTNVSKRSKRYS